MSKPALKPAQVKRFRRAARVELVHRELSITALADKLSLPRSTVSKAINSGRFPRVRAAIAKALAL
jgi:DNA-binding transcriptional regulator WhiA